MYRTLSVARRKPTVLERIDHDLQLLDELEGAVRRNAAGGNEGSMKILLRVIDSRQRILKHREKIAPSDPDEEDEAAEAEEPRRPWSDEERLRPAQKLDRMLGKAFSTARRRAERKRAKKARRRNTPSTPIHPKPTPAAYDPPPAPPTAIAPPEPPQISAHPPSDIHHPPPTPPPTPSPHPPRPPT